MFILPRPQKFEIYEEKIKVSSFKIITDSDEVSKFTDKISDEKGDYSVTFKKDASLCDEHYNIEIKKDGADISYATFEGAYRAYTTLKQIISQIENKELPLLKIEDYPAFKNRGYMLDISRGRLPKLSHLKYIVDVISELKYNQFQLYIEDFVYEFKNFKEYCKDMDPITDEELKELDNYCRERYITLVPTLNGFGHMGSWTSKPEFSHLAISNNEGKPSATLNPFLKESFELVEKMYDGFFEGYTSDLINIGMDEPLELGMSETKEICDKYGVGKVYTDYLKKICNLASEKYGKTPMFWDDIIFKHEEQIDNIPENAIVLDWGYEGDHKFERNCRRLKEKGLRFYVCPGTSMWCSYTGRTENAIFNMSVAAECGKYYDAEGYLLTEWGDGGHPQFPSITMFPLVYGGAVAWSSMSQYNWISDDEKRETIKLCKDYLDKNIYNSVGEVSLADIAYRMGNYYLLEDMYKYNSTEICHYSLKPQLLDERKRNAFLRVRDYMISLKEELKSVKADEISIKEIENNCDAVILISGILSGVKNDYRKDAENLIEEYQKLWKIKSRLPGMERFEKRINKILEVNGY